VHYISTYNTDYILVRENQLTQAIQCFVQSFGVEISVPDDITMEPENDEPIPIPLSPPSQRITNQMFKLEALPGSLCLMSLDKEDLPLCMDTILRLIFFPERSDQQNFLSFTETSSECSMIIDQQDVNQFPDISSRTSRKFLVDVHPWRAIKRVQKLTFYETGVVSAISTPLAEAKISLLYLSVYNTSFIMVRDNKFQEAVKALHNHGFEVLETSGQPLD